MNGKGRAMGDKTHLEKANDALSAAKEAENAGKSKEATEKYNEAAKEFENAAGEAHEKVVQDNKDLKYKAAKSSFKDAGNWYNAAGGILFDLAKNAKKLDGEGGSTEIYPKAAKAFEKAAKAYSAAADMGKQATPKDEKGETATIRLDSADAWLNAATAHLNAAEGDREYAKTVTGDKAKEIAEAESAEAEAKIDIAGGRAEQRAAKEALSD